MPTSGAVNTPALPSRVLPRKVPRFALAIPARVLPDCLCPSHTKEMRSKGQYLLSVCLAQQDMLKESYGVHDAATTTISSTTSWNDVTSFSGYAVDQCALHRRMTINMLKHFFFFFCARIAHKKSCLKSALEKALSSSP